MSAETLIAVEHLAVGYDRKAVLSDISLTLLRGSFTGLLGANGSGKSTLIKTILGIIPPLGGTLTFNLSDTKREVLGYVPQRDTLDPIYLLSAFEVVLMGACARVGPGRRISSTEKDWAHQCLKETGADALSRTLFSRLSGGQKQRVLIARALATKTEFLLLDEPTSGIDAAARQSIMELLKQVHARQHLTILMASHDLPMVRAFVSQVIWLHRGRIVQGSVRELLTAEKIEEILELQTN